MFILEKHTLKIFVRIEIIQQITLTLLESLDLFNALYFLIHSD